LVDIRKTDYKNYKNKLKGLKKVSMKSIFKKRSIYIGGDINSTKNTKDAKSKFLNLIMPLQIK
jgi:hypothetical protein